MKVQTHFNKILIIYWICGVGRILDERFYTDGGTIAAGDDAEYCILLYGTVTSHGATKEMAS